MYTHVCASMHTHAHAQCFLVSTGHLIQLQKARRF